MKIAGIDIEFEWHETLGGSPAKCRILLPGKAAIIKLAKDAMQDLDHSVKVFIILHELGHAVLNTGDEIAVDRWAHRQYDKMKLPLDQSVFALSEVLAPLDDPEHSERVIRQFYRAKHKQFLRGKTSWKQFLKQKHK